MMRIWDNSTTFVVDIVPSVAHVTKIRSSPSDVLQVDTGS